MGVSATLIIMPPKIGGPGGLKKLFSKEYYSAAQRQRCARDVTLARCRAMIGMSWSPTGGKSK